MLTMKQLFLYDFTGVGLCFLVVIDSYEKKVIGILRYFHRILLSKYLVISSICIFIVF